MIFELFPILVLCQLLSFTSCHNCSFYDRNTCRFDSLKKEFPEVSEIYSNNRNYPDDGGNVNNNYNRLNNMIDNEHKIVIFTSPKASSSKSIMIFVSSMKYFYGINYTQAQHFRIEYQKHCGEGSSCLMHDNSWMKIKVVRNPFYRAVSSYLFMMHEGFLPVSGSTSSSVIKKKGKANISFHILIDLLLFKANGFWTFDCAGHIEKQISPIEKLYWERNDPSPFNFIIKSENFESDWTEVSRLTNITFTNNNDKPNHLAVRNNKSTSYVGDTPYGILDIPENYGLFYNDVIKAKVARLFNDDLIIYNYTYPF